MTLRGRKYFKFNRENFENKELIYIDSLFTEISQSSLDAGAWNFLNNEKAELLSKIRRHRTLISVYGKCYYGIKTALNEAFIIEKDLGLFNFLKSVYDGKDLKKWHTTLPFKKMIVFESKSTKKKYGNLEEADALQKMQSEYPEIFNHLLPFKNRAEKRFDKGDYWWELRNCAYYNLFEKPKIIFPNLQNTNKFAFDTGGAYLNAPAVFLPTDDKYLLAILNSKVIWHFLKSICVVRSGGYIEVKPQYFEQIPIPEISNNEKRSFINLVDKILESKKHGKDTTALEAEIDRMVYELYGLTDEEVRVVEGADPTSG